jgi:hypothetical protein
MTPIGRNLPRVAYNALAVEGVLRTLRAFLRSHPGFPTLDDRNTRIADAQFVGKIVGERL